ncbi:MAG: hypothetical protein V6Z81_09440 [Parvularculales bacterium]
MAEVTSQEQNAIPDLNNVGFEADLLCLCWGDTEHSMPVFCRYFLPVDGNTAPLPPTADTWLSSAHFHYFFLWPLYPVLQSKALIFQDCALLPVKTPALQASLQNAQEGKKSPLQPETKE